MINKRVLSLMVVAAALAVPMLSYAAAGLSVEIGGDQYQVSGSFDANDGLGHDWICVVCYNADGSLNDVDIFDVKTGYSGTLGGSCTGVFTYPSIRPLTAQAIDTAAPFDRSLGENSVSALYYCGVISPGPDTIDLTGAVVGSVVTSTPAYFAPNAESATTTIIAAGKTLYVFGLDSSQQFYRVELGGAFFWLPVSTMGPNYDTVWNGTPLPTSVVN
jgi:hypothetical protein